MRNFSAIKPAALLGILFSGYACYGLVMMNNQSVPWWNFFFGILFSICLLCAWGLNQFKRWAYHLSLVLAFAGLGLGIYLVHFGWTFWIFKRPTLMERLAAVAHPRISIFFLFPATWLAYFLRASKAKLFD